MSDAKPLVLDVDGTFLKTDLLLENFWAALARDPLRTLALSFAHFRRPEKLKAGLAAIAPLRTDLMPVNADIRALAAESSAAGREVVLASASNEALVRKVATDHGFSSRIFGSTEEVNLKGAAKAGALVEAYGEKGFDYAGNAPVDAKVWDHAENVIMVGEQPAVAARLAARGRNVVTYEGGWKLADLVKALRPHQWVKNVLLLLPMVAAHEFSWGVLLPVLLGILAFSAAASSIYIVNDLLDLEADRLHPTKCRRPFAAGTVPIGAGMIVGVGLGLSALILAAALNWAFFGIVVLYIATSLAYSLKLKRMRWVDIVVLASLYTIRVIAGAAAGEVAITTAMLVFVFPVFITLGCVKRITELAKAEGDERLPGRGYGRPDRHDLLNVAGIGVFGALLIFFIYTLSPQAKALYPDRWLLWAAMPFLAHWLIRMVRLGWQGKMDYDPIVFAARDRVGLGVMLFTLSLMFWAAKLWQQWFGG
ncbi:UbiA family prenyltransferase [Vannielia litorea]|uniref:UbiA family prenyltransferase n=1 Tax=Vannielia litorea TaxID=1217970 RepID=UPI001BCD0A68|nr:UbiA family prenyltransferase [Vannielia litorea]